MPSPTNSQEEKRCKKEYSIKFVLGFAELEFFIPVSWTVLMTLVISPKLRRNIVVFSYF